TAAHHIYTLSLHDALPICHKRDALDRLVASYAGMSALLARGTVDVIPAALYRDPLREAILKLYPTLKEGCRRLGIAYGLLFNDRSEEHTSELQSRGHLVCR